MSHHRNATPSKPETDWQSIEVTVTALDLLNLVAAACRYADTGAGSYDIDAQDMRESRDRCFDIWMDAIRANPKRRGEYVDIISGI